MAARLAVGMVLPAALLLALEVYADHGKELVELLPLSQGQRGLRRECLSDLLQQSVLIGEVHNFNLVFFLHGMLVCELRIKFGEFTFILEAFYFGKKPFGNHSTPL